MAFFLDSYQLIIYNDTMNIIFDSNLAIELKEKYTVLELDTVMQPALQAPVVLHAVVEKFNLTDLPSITFYKETHENMIAAYKAGDWDVAIDLLKVLTGQWSGELDSFYEMALDFCQENAKLNKTWDGIRHTIPTEDN